MKEESLENIKKDIKKYVEQSFFNLLGENVPDHVVDDAVEDVLETSAVSEGKICYTKDDVLLACRQTILRFLKDE